MGEEVSIVFGYLDKTLTEFYGYGDELFDEFVRLSREDPKKSISELVEGYKPHIIHSHNAPDFLTVSAINVVDDTPVIHDTHDALTMRKMGHRGIRGRLRHGPIPSLNPRLLSASR